MSRSELLTIVVSTALLLVSCVSDDDKDLGDVNSPPIAVIEVDFDSGTVETIFTFNANLSTDDETPFHDLQTRWDWEDDGIFDTAWDTTKVTTHQYNETGIHSVRLQVKDSDDAIDDDICSITVSESVNAPELTFVPAGTFLMGSNNGNDDEQPVHQVILNHDFYLGTYKVTNEEYRAALQWAYDQGLVTATSSTVQAHGEELLNLDNEGCEITFSGGFFGLRESPYAQDAYPDGYDAADHPVTQVSWYGATCYCDWLSLISGTGAFYNSSWDQVEEHNPYTSVGFRLPTEAEWEYAAQYNDDRRYSWGEESPTCAHTNFFDGYGYCIGWTAPVGSYPLGANLLSFYDVSGNVWEWVGDWYTYDYYTYSPPTDPLGPGSSSLKVTRGGAWDGGWAYLQLAWRGTNYEPEYSSYAVGFRVCRTANP